MVMRNENACVRNPNDFFTNPGSRYRTLYSPIVDSFGVITLVESGKEDIQEFIQSQKAHTDMSFILSRMAAGDTSVLTDKQPMYGDFTVMPKTYAEALQLVIDREADFMKLPLEVRNKFNNDFRQWFAQSGTEAWFEKMASVLPEKEKSIEDVSAPSEEVKE